MGDSLKSKNSTRSSARGTSNGNLAPGNRTLSPRADLDSQITASTGPVTSVKDASSWLKKKGWILATEQCSKTKLAQILFTAVLSFKLPPEVDTALRSVAYLICDQGEDDFASSVSAELIDKITNKLSDPIDKLTNSISSANTFLLAASQQQATELLSLQESVKQQNDLTKSLAESSEKLIQSSASRGLTDTAWLLLSASNPTSPHSIHPASLLHTHNSSPAVPKLLHQVSLASKQLLIDYGPLDENEAPWDKSIESQRDLRQLFNQWTDNFTITPVGEDPPPIACDPKRFHL